MPTKGRYTDADLAPPVEDTGVPPPTEPDQPSLMSRVGQGALDLYTGAAKGAMHTADQLGHLVFPDVLARKVGLNPPTRAQEESYFAPKNTAETIGKGAEQAAEFMLPGGAEERLASMAPRAVRPLARIGASALSSGTVNKLQGGSFATGAAGGAAGSTVGAGLRAMAPKLAESALGVTKADRAFSRTLGKSILEETRGLRPERIASTGQTNLNRLTPQLENAAAHSTAPFSLRPARVEVSGAMGKAARENAASLHGQLGEMQNFLGTRFDTGQPIPPTVMPREGLDLKRGFSTEFLGRWNPETHGGTLATGRNAYHALDRELDRTVPQAAGLNQRISSLIPVVHRAESVSRNAPTSQLLMRRIAAPTGALVGPLFGAEEGYRHGGVPGAIAGGTAGAIAPLLIATPEGQMALARGFNTARGLRPIVGGALQLNRPNAGGGTEGTQ